MIIICNTHEEAQDVYRLQPFIASIDMSQSVPDVARIIASSSLVYQTLRSADKFYPVAYGISETAVHRDWYVFSCDCIFCIQRISIGSI